MPDQPRPLPPPAPPRIFTFEQSAQGDETGYPIHVRRRVDQGETHLHEHLYHEIVFVENGTADHVSAEGVRKLRVGDLLVIKPRIWHGYRNPVHFGIVNCLFDRRILIHQQVFLSLLEGAFALFQKPPPRPRATPPTFLHAAPSYREQLVSHLNAMIRERHEKQAHWEGALVSHLLNLIVIISRLDLPAEPQPLTDKARDFANEVMIHLETHFREKITLPALSTHFHVSPSYLSRLFTKRMGMSIIDYTNHLRIEAACHLLRSTDWPVTRIATEVGYDEVAYFFRRFRREIGKSPQHYRTGQPTSHSTGPSNPPGLPSA